MTFWTQGHKPLFMLKITEHDILTAHKTKMLISYFLFNITEHDILTAHKTKMLINKDISCCFKTLRCFTQLINVKMHFTFISGINNILRQLS